MDDTGNRAVRLAETREASVATRSGPPVPAGLPIGHASPSRTFLVSSAVFVALFAVLLLTRLGHYALWDDEANTALFAQGVWRTGDTSAVVGHNVVAYRNGYELEGLRNRTIPPLQYYVCAPFIGLLGPSAFAARLPFALFGFAAVLLVVWWLARRDLPLSTVRLIYLGLLTNVSLLLYLRQARYYALVIFFSLLVAYLHVERDGSRRKLVALCVAGAGLALSSYVAYAALAIALAGDYFVLGRRERRYRPADLALVAVSQGAACLGALAIWNPVGKKLADYQPESWILDKLMLIGWNIRDMNGSEFVVGLLILIAPLLYFTVRRDPVLLRVPIGIVVYAVAVAIVSPQPVGKTSVADVRHLIAIIPAGVFVAARVLAALPRLGAPAKLAIAFIAFFTNAANAAIAPFSQSWTPPVRSTIWAYLGELRSPQSSPYAAAATWVRSNVRPGESVYVLPRFATYPLMFHAPHAIYAWQLSSARRTEFPELPPIHFASVRALPDYIVALGHGIPDAVAWLETAARIGIRYERAAVLDVYGVDLTRPELLWRSFTSRPAKAPEVDGICVYRRVPPRPP